MLMVLCIFLIVSFFEFRHLLKAKEKKEATVYAAFSAAAVFLAVFLMLTPDYTSFSRMIFNLFNIGQ
jgi:purine-cytosine permease-like protein